MNSYLKHFVIPFFFFMTLIIAMVGLQVSWIPYRQLLLILPWPLFLISSVAALYLLQFGFFYTAALYAAVLGVIQWHLQSTLADPLTFAAFAVVNILFPLLMMGVVLVSQSRLLSWPGLTVLVLMVCLLGLPFLFWSIDTAALLAHLPDVLWRPVVPGWQMPLGLLVSYLPVLIFLCLLYGLNPTALTAQWLTGLLAVFATFTFFSTPFISALVFSVLGLLLLISLIQEAFQLAFVDELTSIPGRKALQKQMLGLGRRYSIAMLDVDHFKSFNDTHGHDVGDQVLRMVAAKIAQVNGGGKAFRYGGEEFTILFPGKTAQQTMDALEQVRLAVAGYQLQLREPSRPQDNKSGKKQRQGVKRKSVSVTISIGVAQATSQVSEPEQVIKLADKALYAAKQAGRNCVKRAKQ